MEVIDETKFAACTKSIVQDPYINYLMTIRGRVLACSFPINVLIENDILKITYSKRVTEIIDKIDSEIKSKTNEIKEMYGVKDVLYE